MSILKLYRDRLRNNYEYLSHFFAQDDIDWGIVTKLLCGNQAFLQEVIDLGCEQLLDARISNLKQIKELAPDIQTVYIKPPPMRSIPSLVAYADVSFNTEYSTIKALSDEAVRQGKLHKVIIMIELGDLREGVLGENIKAFYEKVFELPGVRVIGLGANLNCLHGVMPNQDKLVQLVLYREILELKFGRKIPWISGGSSVTIQLMLQKKLPKGVNHFRIGETLFYGNNLFTGKTIKGMHNDVFELFAEIIELREKPVMPYGELAENPSGEMTEIDEDRLGETSVRAILDIGLLDINPKFLSCSDKQVRIVGAASDMLVVNLGKNKNRYKVGDHLRFRIKYMGALHLMNSDYVIKEVVESAPVSVARNGKSEKEEVSFG